MMFLKEYTPEEMRTRSRREIGINNGVIGVMLLFYARTDFLSLVGKTALLAGIIFGSTGIIQIVRELRGKTDWTRCKTIHVVRIALGIPICLIGYVSMQGSELRTLGLLVGVITILAGFLGLLNESGRMLAKAEFLCGILFYIQGLFWSPSLCGKICIAVGFGYFASGSHTLISRIGSDQAST
ncbi:MAG: hypothetical protein LUC98_12500 [Lachnospiraceae bacterium]|nr:hypothetical protein [Lachnospiraceae bacterium]